jgi:Tol biopolymer transport system component
MFPSASPADGQLDCWKEIASYLGREIRTVQRWEKEEGLPVHRHLHRKQGSVCALRPEIDVWMKSRQALLDKPETGLRRPPLRMALAAAALAAAGLLAGRWIGRTDDLRPYLQTEISLPPQSVLMNGPSLALSPDGRSLVLAASSGLWLRNLSETSQRLLAGTGDAIGPFWSPDGREIGFFSSGKLKKLTLPDSAPVVLADALDPQGAAWSSQGLIVFAPRLEGPLVAIPAGGGAPAPVSRLNPDRNEYLHSAPNFLPGGEQFLYVAKSRDRQKDAVVLGSVHAPSAPPSFLVASSTGAVFAPGRNGRDCLLFVKEGNLVAQALDRQARRLTGAPRIVARRIRFSGFGSVDLSVSNDGTLVYAVDQVKTTRPKWFARDGSHLGEVGEPSEFKSIRLSKDLRRLAAVRADSSDFSLSLWWLDVARGVDTRLLGGGFEIGDPVWSPDGLRLVFCWDRPAGGANLYSMAVAGPYEPEPLLPAGRDRWPLDWSPDGRLLVYAEIDSATQFDIWALPMDPAGAPFPLVRTAGKDNEARLSPDGTFLAYQSDESGHVQVYVQAMPPASGRWQVSVDHGAEPRWRADGRELYYISGDNALMAAPFLVSGAQVTPGKPVRLFGGRGSGLGTQVWKYEPSPDGQRFLVLTPSEKSADTPVHLALNWQTMFQ